MKIKELEKLVSSKTFDDLEVNVTDAFVSNEFNRKFPFSREDRKDYRDRAIDALVSHRLPISSNNNIVCNVAGRYVVILCPYCGEKMQPKGGGGNSEKMTTEYNCKCGASCSLSVGHHDLEFSPSK